MTRFGPSPASYLKLRYPRSTCHRTLRYPMPFPEGGEGHREGSAADLSDFSPICATLRYPALLRSSQVAQSVNRPHSTFRTIAKIGALYLPFVVLWLAAVVLS